MNEVVAWAAGAERAFANRRGGELAGILHGCPIFSGKIKVETAIKQIQRHPFSEVVLRVAEASQLIKKPEARFQKLLEAFAAFTVVHMEQRQPSTRVAVGWDTPILVALLQLIDAASLIPGAVDDETMPNVIGSWRKLFIFLQNADPDSRNEVARRRGALAVVNCLLAILFRHGNTHQCKVLMSTIDQAEASADGDRKGILGPCGHMVSEVVKVHYFQGRLKLYEGEYVAAFNAFRKGYGRMPPLNDCSPPVRNNKLRFQFYWIVSGLLAGYRPPVELLEGDDLIKNVFSNIIEAVCSGSSTLLDATLWLFAPFLANRSVYMLLKVLQVHCRMVLLRQLHSALASQGQDSSRIPIPLLAGIRRRVDDQYAPLLESAGARADDPFLHFTDSDEEQMGARNANVGTKRAREEVEALCAKRGFAHQTDYDSTCFMLVRLISTGFVRGYISYEHQILVLGKKDPFPVIALPATV